LLDYIQLTQITAMPNLQHPKLLQAQHIMTIDHVTRKSLELTTAQNGERYHSLLGTIDRTASASGARLLHARICNPLCSADAINARLDCVEFFVSFSDYMADLRQILQQMPDVERAVARVALARATPHDLAAIAQGLALIKPVAALLHSIPTGLPPALQPIVAGLGVHDTLLQELEHALCADPPLQTRTGGFIRKGYASQLDQQIALRDDARHAIAQMQMRYRKETGIDNLKISHNNILGYYIEISSKHAESIGENFFHRQTMKNVVRYSTADLGELTRDINEAAEKAIALEQEIFAALCAEILAEKDNIALSIDAIANLDCASALADLAIDCDYCRPLIDDSNEFSIQKGRHAIVEASITRESQFIANDCDLCAAQRLWLITGPNMAGKSTFMRQNALICVLAHIGSYIPAQSGHIGIVSKIFSRVGAQDDLAHGRSTFMVEMVETASILHNCDARTLVIIDEIGRGTATYDGLAIAWACLEYLHDQTSARVLFSTHYHELNALADGRPAIQRYSMAVREWKNKVIFLHSITPGPINRSYGIHVARLAGLPGGVVKRAEQLLAGFEAQVGQSDLPLFTHANTQIAEQNTSDDAPDSLREQLRDLQIDDMTPREALDMLYELYNHVKNEEGS
ncbi:MAG: DNA mismatch repair protein MutS, partial [Pseudomonadota bacterium]